MWLTKTLGEALLPPLLIILCLWLGLALWRCGSGRFARLLVLLATLALTLLSSPLVADLLARRVEPYPALTDEAIAAAVSGGVQAIVVLAGGYDRAEEYGGLSVNTLSLQRLRYGVWLHRRSGLPVALVGGRVYAHTPSEAALMQEVLEGEYGLAARWVEGHSRNTAENARRAAALLAADGVSRVFLVTHAFHMPRSLEQFRARGLDAVPAPTGFLAGRTWRFSARRLLPAASALQRSYLALHEMLGRLWYALRYR
jgi:uncharacterized SAM-binding protein YcdF (DUF218 family)